MKTKKAHVVVLLMLCLLAALAALAVPSSADRLRISQGACCMPDGSCQIKAEGDCTASGGVYLGNDISCEGNPCGPVGGVTESLVTSAIVVPALALAAMVGAGAATAAFIKRRTT